MIKKADSRRAAILERQARFYEKVLPIITETPNQTSLFYAKILGLSTGVTARLLLALSKKTGIERDVRRRRNGKIRICLWRLDHQPKAPLFLDLKRVALNHKEQASLEARERREKRAIEKKLAEQVKMELREKKREESEKKREKKREESEKKNAIKNTKIREYDKGGWCKPIKKTPQEKLLDLLNSMEHAPIPSYEAYFKEKKKMA